MKLKRIRNKISKIDIDFSKVSVVLIVILIIYFLGKALKWW